MNSVRDPLADFLRPSPWRTLRRSVIWRLLRAAAVAFLVLVLSLMFIEERLIFFPSRYPIGDWTPAGLAFEDAWFDSPEGLRLHGWYVPHPRPLAYLLFCHGNAGNITHRAEIAALMHRRAGVAVLVFDYRGYGRSQGRPSESGILADARAARAWLAKRAGMEERQVVVFGESIGGAVAVDLAAADGARALILENTFTNLPEVAAYHFPWLPLRWLMRTRLDSLRKIALYHGPLLQSHGDPDSVVPYHFGQRLFEAANQPKKFITLRGFDHNDPRPPEYYDDMRRFLETVGSRQ